MCEGDGMEEWKECKLGDITSLITKGTTPSMIGANFTTNGIKYIKSECILENSRLLDSSKYTFISTETNERLKRSQIIENDILFSMAGMFLGKTGIATKDDVPANTNQAVAIIRITPEKADFKYVYYFLNQKALITYINGISGQSAQPNINLQQISELNIKLPPLPTQQKIAAILSSLDDKIELNNKINTNLDQQAQALFKNWFVDFEPFGGKMPEGWKIGKLGDFVDIKRGGSPRPIQKFLSDEGYRWLKISDVTSLSAPFVLNIAEHIKEEGLSKTVFLKAGSLVLSNSATPGIPKILDLDTCIHDGWLYFPKSQLSNEYLYLLFKEIRPQLLNLGNGSIFTNLKTDILKNFEISLPSTETLSKFQNIIKPIFEKVLATQREIKQLETLRDTLLPKLMNGEIALKI